MDTDYDTAFEEFVADSMEAMLTDTNAAERIAGLKETDKTAWEKLKEIVHKLLESIKGLYEQYSPSSVEGKRVREMGDSLEKLSDLFVEGMSKVGEPGTSTTTSNGQRVLYQKRTTKNNEVVGIKQQIKNSKAQLDEMPPVVSKTVSQDLHSMSIKQKRAWAEAEIKKAGFSVDRQGYGRVLIEPSDINSALNYIKDDGEISAFSAIHAVLRRGKEVFRDVNHKNRGYDTVTFAAPVVINNVRGNMAVVVRETGKNRYDMHRIVLPNGSAFEFAQKANAVSTAVGGITEGAKSSGEVAPTINTASTATIPNSSKNVNKNFSTQERGTSNREILTTALDSAAQNPREREVLAEYKAAADKLETYEMRLRENRAKVQELTAENEKKNARRIAKLKEDIKADENRVGNVTDQMETLEKRESLRALLAREREAIVVQQKEQVRQLKERLDEYREKYGTFPGGEKAAREILHCGHGERDQARRRTSSLLCRYAILTYSALNMGSVYQECVSLYGWRFSIVLKIRLNEKPESDGMNIAWISANFIIFY